MRAVTFSLDGALVDSLREALRLTVLVETGTGKDDNVAQMLPLFERIVTVELSESLRKAAAERFAGAAARPSITAYARKLGVNWLRAAQSIAENRVLRSEFAAKEVQKTSAVINEVGFQEMNRIRERALGRVPSGREVRKAVFPYLLKHVATDLGWAMKNRLGLRT